MVKIYRWLLQKIVRHNMVPTREVIPDAGIMMRGELARQLGDNPIFKEFIEDARKRLYKDFSSTEVLKWDAREQIYALAKALDIIELQLNKYVSEAMLQAKTEEMKEKTKKGVL